jgi:hypothetical protein
MTSEGLSRQDYRTIKERHQAMLHALSRIASGKSAKPLNGEEARQLARETLVAMGERWPKQPQYFRVERIADQAVLVPMEALRDTA